MNALPELTIARVIQACGKVEGRVKLQKIVYLLSAMGYDLPYRDFRVRHYGPFAPRLAAALDFLVESQVVDEQPQDVGAECPRFDYTPSSRYLEVLSKYAEVAPATNRPTLDDVAPRIACHDRATLEIAATMRYLHEEEGHSGDELQRQLRALKGHLPEFDAKLQAAAALLSELGLSVA